MKRFLLGFLLLIPFITISQEIDFNHYFSDNTLNILSYHSGRKGMEYYSIEESFGVRNWAGSKKHLIDNTKLGVHKIEIYDIKTKTLIYSHNYCSLFEEWQSTPEAKNSCGNFEEVLRIPFPKHDIEIIFSSRDSLNNWFEVKREEIEVKNLYIKESNKENKAPIPLHIASEDLSKALDIIIIPAGYTKADSTKMLSDLKVFSSQFFSKPPFSEMKNKINIWGIPYFSEENGIPGLDSSININTFLGVSYNTFGSPRYIMTKNLFNLHSILENSPYEQIVIMCNSSIYGGGGIFNFYATSYFNPNNSFVLIHEFGHSFAGLGDEYSESDIEVEGAKQGVEPWQKNVTSLVDFKTKWVDLIEKTTPIPTPCTKEYSDKVGVYEGAAYLSKGLFRPYQNCLMRSDKPFCPVCTREIIRMIKLYSE